MVKHDIEVLRARLNSLIEGSSSYDEIYNISVELDKLIVQFYREFNRG